MELSTVVRILSVPTAGINPSDLASGTLLYVEDIGTDGLGALFYAGGDDGTRHATYLKQVTSVPGVGQQVIVDNATIKGNGTILSPLSAKVYTTTDFEGDGSEVNPLALTQSGIARFLPSSFRAGNNISLNFDAVSQQLVISGLAPSAIDGGSA